ncbi:helix-turn-helix domain-containing protein [Limosilactobacillus avistercoris]|uniref:helix-turn-helix domain-containing protein n=1 Tax=Limosilactobacillus avistercoris TaxID=2762243 RepID=UPI00296AAE49|nr:MerR family transcriptional regulator [Limosilactobacillus avistercoris]
MSEKYSIGEVAKKLNMTPRAICFYEEKNLVTPDSIGKNGYRYYQEKQIQKLELVNWIFQLVRLKVYLMINVPLIHYSYYSGNKLAKMKKKFYF